MIETAALRQVPDLADLPEENLAWFAAQGDDLRLQPGDALTREGEPADYMFVFLEGEIQMRRESNPADRTVFTARAGQITGMLPYSRLTHFMGTGRAIVPTRVARFHKNVFPEMMQRMPVLTERLVGVMMDRVREVTKISEQRDRLAALGKLSAGLAHELNNPAAAAKRAASSLREIRECLRGAYLHLDQIPLTTDQRAYIAGFENDALDRIKNAITLSATPLEQSDREEELGVWMDSHKIAESWRLAPGLAEVGLTVDKLDEFHQRIGGDALGASLVRINYSLSAMRLIIEIEQSTTRISELVQAIKEYTYMDQAPEQEIDIHAGIESTLTILAFKLRRKSINVIRDFDHSLPKICAYGVELNQVWTNLIVNAIEAMNEGGELQIRTCGTPHDVMIEIRDNGSGIPPQVLPHIFDPFFTTKGVGEGTGLGLDTSMRVVRKHRGDIRVQSNPGNTCFTVRLPKQAHDRKESDAQLRAS